MNTHDRKRFAQILTALAEVKGKQLSAPGIALFWDAMRSSWSIEEFEAGAKCLMRTFPYFPDPYRFEELRKAKFPTTAEAFDMARRACGTSFVHGQVTDGGTCGNELIDRAVRGLGGYKEIALCAVGQLPFLERRFAEHYQSILDAEATRDALPQIAARIDAPLLLK